ncbi:hypothetical protein BCR33DRAFT_716861, partial [Rhizoclosmatium globosum]
LYGQNPNCLANGDDCVGGAAYDDALWTISQTAWNACGAGGCSRQPTCTKYTNTCLKLDSEASFAEGWQTRNLLASALHDIIVCNTNYYPVQASGLPCGLQASPSIYTYPVGHNPWLMVDYDNFGRFGTLMTVPDVTIRAFRCQGYGNSPVSIGDIKTLWQMGDNHSAGGDGIDVCKYVNTAASYAQLAGGDAATVAQASTIMCSLKIGIFGFF